MIPSKRLCNQLFSADQRPFILFHVHFFNPDRILLWSIIKVQCFLIINCQHDESNITPLYLFKLLYQNDLIWTDSSGVKYMLILIILVLLTEESHFSIEVYR